MTELVHKQGLSVLQISAAQEENSSLPWPWLMGEESSLPALAAGHQWEEKIWFSCKSYRLFRINACPSGSAPTNITEGNRNCQCIT